MAGYGNADDHIAAQENHVADSLALHRLNQQQNNNQTGDCQECGDPIPEARLKAVPNALYCAHCQNMTELKGQQRARFTVKSHYQP